jgi:hypothetical protein
VLINSLVIGRRGLGKSTLAEWLADQETDNKIVFDPNNQFKDALVSTSDLEEFQEHLEASENSDEPFFLAFVPVGEVEMEWDRFAPVIWPYGDYALIIDESHWLQKPNYINPWLSRFMRQAPRRERDDENPVDIIMTAHRPTDINGIVLGLSDFEYIFRTTKSRDIKYLEQEFGEEIADRVQHLRTPQSEDPGRDVIRVPVESPEDFEVLTDSREWFVNIRKPRENSLDNVIREVY